MRTIRNVLEEIEQLKREIEMLEGMSSEMIQDDDIGSYMKETFGIGFMDIVNIKNRLRSKAEYLESRLEDIEIDI